jgi:hypothetical protein
VSSSSYLNKDIAGGRGSEVGRAEISCTSHDPLQLARLRLSAQLAAHDKSPSLEEVDETKSSRRLELEDALAQVARPTLIPRWPALGDAAEEGEELSMRLLVGDSDFIECLPDGTATPIFDGGGDDPCAARDDSESNVNSTVDIWQGRVTALR